MRGGTPARSQHGCRTPFNVGGAHTRVALPHLVPLGDTGLSGLKGRLPPLPPASIRSMGDRGCDSAREEQKGERWTRKLRPVGRFQGIHAGEASAGELAAPRQQRSSADATGCSIALSEFEPWVLRCSSWNEQLCSEWGLGVPCTILRWWCSKGGRVFSPATAGSDTVLPELEPDVSDARLASRNFVGRGDLSGPTPVRMQQECSPHRRLSPH